jgi:hypothetical protein
MGPCPAAAGVRAARPAARGVPRRSRRRREALGDPGKERLVIAQALGHRPLEREHPLAVAHRRQHVVDQQRGPLRPPPAHARWATAAILAREGHAQLVAACPAGRPHKASLEVPVHAEARELVLHELRQRMTGLLEARDESRQMPPHQHGRIAVVGLPRDVYARPRACGHGARLCTRPAGRCRSQVGEIATHAANGAHRVVRGRATRPTRTPRRGSDRSDARWPTGDRVRRDLGRPRLERRRARRQPRRLSALPA